MCNGTCALLKPSHDLPEQGKNWGSQRAGNPSPGLSEQPVWSPCAKTSGIPSAEHWAKPPHCPLLWSDAPAPRFPPPGMTQPEYDRISEGERHPSLLRITECWLFIFVGVSLMRVGINYIKLQLYRNSFERACKMFVYSDSPFITLKNSPCRGIWHSWCCQKHWEGEPGWCESLKPGPGSPAVQDQRQRRTEETSDASFPNNCEIEWQPWLKSHNPPDRPGYVPLYSSFGLCFVALSI